MANKVLNFDQFISEHSKAKVEVTVFGKVYKVPCEIPAIVPVMMARAEQGSDVAMSSQMIIKAADSLFGADVVNEFCDKGMTAPMLAELVRRMFDVINGKTDEAEDEAEELSDEDSRVASSSRKKAEKK